MGCFDHDWAEQLKMRDGAGVNSNPAPSLTSCNLSR
jgi:hypothetical protein